MKARLDVRRHRIYVSISERERRRVAQIAKREGKPVAVVLYELARAELDRRAPPEEPRK